jgi:membrane-associated PAP2 superfamily phosphatase
VLFVAGGRDSKTLSEPSLAWSFLAIALLLLMGLGAGFSMFMRGARFSSINSRRI